MAKKHRRTIPRHLPVTTSPREGWGTALEVGGVTQSVSVPAEMLPLNDGELHPGPGGGYWGLLLPPGCPRRALLLGLGGGTVAHLLARRCPNISITGIERDPAVIVVARQSFGLDDLPQLSIVEADAFAWIDAAAACRAGEYDLICLDLFEAGRLVHGALATPFLRQLAMLLAPDGTLTVNLMATARTPDQVHRLQRVFHVKHSLRLRGNLVVHAHARSPDEDNLIAEGAEDAARNNIQPQSEEKQKKRVKRPDDKIYNDNAGSDLREAIVP